VPIDAELFARLDRLLEQALDQPEQARQAWIRDLPPEYDELKPRLMALLSSAPAGASPLDRSPAFGTAPQPGPVPQLQALELAHGERLGRYQIRGVLGAGGMGRVYRAFDPVLAREVAIKTLSRGFRADAAGLRQVEREARILATLSHPNIGAIHGLEQLDGAPCLVLELVEGQTLAERLERGPLPLEAAVAVAGQVAAALEEAHRRGIVHRDLKPANVKVSPEGRVKVIDFGIARALSPFHAGGATLTVTADAGLARGTVPYMSPEQIRGEPIDTRSDVWAFGCLLFEMLTGQRAFQGATAPEVVAAVLRDPLRWEALPRRTPAALRRLLRRCLTRDPSDRLQAIGDARLELTELERGDAAEPAPILVRRLAPWVLGAMALLAGALALVQHRPPPPAQAAHLSVELPAGLTLAGGYAAPFELSPDGSRIALVVLKDGARHLAVRSLYSLGVILIPGTEGAWQPAFSPDGRELVFFADRKLKKVAVDGGPILVLAEVGEVPRGASWGADGRIVFAPSQVSGLSEVPAAGGPVRPVTRVDLDRGESSHRWPAALPGGKWLLLTVGLDSESFDQARLEVVSRVNGERRLVMAGASQGRFALGHLFYVHEGRLYAVPFDPSTARVTGRPAVLADAVHYQPGNGGAHYAVSDRGLLLYAPGGGGAPEYHLAWVDARGRLARLPGPPRRFREPRISPDGRRVAVVVGAPPDADLWVLDVDSGAFTRLTFGLSPHRPTWTPDGRAITVGAEQGGRWRLVDVPAAGGGEPSTLLESEHRVYPDAWTPEGRRLLYEELRPHTGWDIRSVEVGAGGDAKAGVRDLLASPFEERKASLSPDGRLVAFESNELDGVNGVFVTSLQQPGARIRATPTYANCPRWGSDGRLYYWYPAQARTGDSTDPEGVYRVDWVASGDSTSGPGQRAPVWPEAPGSRIAGRLNMAPYAGFDVGGSGQGLRILALETSDDGPAPVSSPVLVLGLGEELRLLGDRP